MREKYNLIQELQKKNEELVGDKRLSLVGQTDFPGGNNVTRGTMNEKHISQHLVIDNPEFPIMYDGKENIRGRYSSFYTKTKKTEKVVAICKKYNERMKGKAYYGLVFTYCPEDDAYHVYERKEIENLTENFGFSYNNDYLDLLEVGETIPANTVLSKSTSYDDTMNASVGVNGRIMYVVHPALQDDAIIISKSFAKRMVANDITVKTIPLNENTILLNKYGKDGEYQGLPNIGDFIYDGILAVTRTVKESRMFSDMRDASLRNPNMQGDTIFYCSGGSEVIDINVYVNSNDPKVNKVTKQYLSYYTDAKWFYSQVYKTCKDIIKRGASHVDQEIHRWMRKSMNYLDTQAKWAFNDNIFSNAIIEITLRKREQLKVGRKITGEQTCRCKTWLIAGIAC